MRYLRIYRTDLNQHPHLEELIWMGRTNKVDQVAYWGIPETHPNFEFIYLIVGDRENWAGFDQESFDAEDRWQNYPYAFDIKDVVNAA